MRYYGLDMFAPCAIVAFQGLEAHLRRETRFRVFETYRDPVRQLQMVREGRSKALPFTSAHQVGLAADFVPYGPFGWVWPDAADKEWDVLSDAARQFGLVCPIEWDRPHVEHPRFRNVLLHLKK